MQTKLEAGQRVGVVNHPIPELNRMVATVLCEAAISDAGFDCMPHKETYYRVHFDGYKEYILCERTKKKVYAAMPRSQLKLLAGQRDAGAAAFVFGAYEQAL